MKKKTRQKVYEKFDGRCAYCGKTIEYKDMQVDHLKAKKNGGTDDLDNLMPACRRCNHYKRTADLETFRTMISEIPAKLMRDSYTYKVAADYGFMPTEKQKIVFYFEKMAEEDRQFRDQIRAIASERGVRL